MCVTAQFAFFMYLCVSLLRLTLNDLSMYTDHPYYTAVQFHPEYISRPMKPSPPYHGLLLAACGKINTYLARGNRGSPYSKLSDSDLSSDEDLVEELKYLNVKAAAASLTHTVLTEGKKEATANET